MDLFESSLSETLAREAPLAARMRPETIDEVVGQNHLLSDGKPLRALLDSGVLSSLILWGPPGTGKTTIARILAERANAEWVAMSAVSAGTADVRKVIAEARDRLAQNGRRTVLFLDEIHRFNKTQQDALLPAVEDGILILVGATTENPYFYVNSPLLSRSLLFQLEPLAAGDLEKLLVRAGTDPRGLGGSPDVSDEAVGLIVEKAGGDARFAFNALEVAALLAREARETEITRDLAATAIQSRRLEHDRAGDSHYGVVSAFIKSMRGTDPDAALYWMSRMLEAGEDPRFIARRMVIFASEDVGNADPRALMVAVAAAQAVEMVGLPEAALNLGHAVTYLASAPKSNASYMALNAARTDVSEHGPLPVPLHLRGTGYCGAEALGHGVDYLYPHDYPDALVAQQYMPDDLRGRVYYRPAERGAEAAIAERLRAIRARQKSRQKSGASGGGDEQTG